MKATNINNSKIAAKTFFISPIVNKISVSITYTKKNSFFHFELQLNSKPYSIFNYAFINAALYRKSMHNIHVRKNKSNYVLAKESVSW